MLESSSFYLSTNEVVYSCRYCVMAEFDPFVFTILSTYKYINLIFNKVIIHWLQESDIQFQLK